MKSHIFLVIFPFFVLLHVVDAVKPLNEELRQEFHKIASERLEYLLEHESNTEPFVTMTISLTNCRTSAKLPKITTGWKQSILEEDMCGTWRMDEWCAEKPGRSGMMTIESAMSNRTALVHFKCLYVPPPPNDFIARQALVTRINAFLIVALFIGMAYSWYRTCTRPVPIHPSKILNLKGNREESDSFESMTFNSTRNFSTSRISMKNRSNYSATAKKFRIIV